MTGNQPTRLEYETCLARIKGQVRAVKRMIDDVEFCIDMITRMQVARPALQYAINGYTRKTPQTMCYRLTPRAQRGRYEPET